MSALTQHIAFEGKQPIRFEKVSLAVAQRLSPDPKMLAIVRVKGDSMEPTISSDDEVMIDRGQTNISDGEIYVFKRNEMLFIKRLAVENGQITVTSDNPSYQPYRFCRNFCAGRMWYGS